MKSFFTNLKQRYNIRDYKISLVFLVTLISLVGILMVRSARPDLMNRQIMGVCLGLIVMFIISFIDYKWILNLYWPLYALNIVMLLAVLVFGTKVNGARRWLNLGFTQFQPSDLTKILVYNNLYCRIVCCPSLPWRIKLQTHWNRSCNHNTDDHYTTCCCNTAKPAVLKRLSAGTYPCMAGT